MKQYAWTWAIKPDRVEEYAAMHQSPWPALQAELSKAGLRNHSIFRWGNRFFYYVESDDIDAAFAYIDRSEVCGKWNALTSAMVEGSFDFGEAQPIAFLERCYYLP